MTDREPLSAARKVIAANPYIADAIEATANGDGCFGRCDAGRVRGAHLANHTPHCAHLQMLLGQDVPDDYTWNGKRFIYTPDKANP